MRTFCALLLAITLPIAVQAQDTTTAVKAALDTQVEAWNRGDLSAFVATYAEDCTFVGKTVMHGRDQVLARYQNTYSTRDAMGKLTFSNLVVRLLDRRVAVVTGEFHLDRSTAGGGNASGLFSLVFELQNHHWLIALDHTS